MINRKIKRDHMLTEFKFVIGGKPFENKDVHDITVLLCNLSIKRNKYT